MNSQIENFMKLYDSSMTSLEYNLFEAASMKEFRHSEILYRLLGYPIQGRLVFLERFLNRLSVDTSTWKFDTGKVFLSREEHIEGRPIDVLVRCATAAMIIENKCCNACDMDAQIKDYIENVKNQYAIAEDNLMCLYLRRIDSLEKPSERSTEDEHHADMVTVSSYRELVLPWLREDVLPNLPRASGVMESSLISYIDMLEAWSGERARMLKDGARAVNAFKVAFGCEGKPAHDLCNTIIGVGDEVPVSVVSALETVKRVIWEEDPIVDTYLLAEELKWMLKNNACPFGRTAMHHRLDTGSIFDYGSIGRWRNVVKLERRVKAPDGRVLCARLHFNPQNMLANEPAAWCMYGGFCECIDDVPYCEDVMQMLSGVGFAKAGLPNENNGFFFFSSKPLNDSLTCTGSGREKIWHLALRLSECAHAYSDALLKTGYVPA